MGLDIGPKAIEQFKEALKGSKVFVDSFLSLVVLLLILLYGLNSEV